MQMKCSFDATRKLGLTREIDTRLCNVSSPRLNSGGANLRLCSARRIGRSAATAAAVAAVPISGLVITFGLCAAQCRNLDAGARCAVGRHAPTRWAAASGRRELGARRAELS